MSYNEELEDLVDHHFIDQSKLTKKKQMGGVGWLLNGNMCCGIYEDLLVVRIESYYAASLIRKPGVEKFGIKGNPDDSFISLVKDIYTHPKALRKFLDNAYEYTATLPPKKDPGFQVPR